MQEREGEQPEAAQGGGDYGYDLVHESLGAPGVGATEPGAEPPEATPVATESSDEGGDYGYDLAHDVPPPG